MRRIDGIVGNRYDDSELDEQVMAHEDAGTLERVVLEAAERRKSRLRVETDSGTDLGVLVEYQYAATAIGARWLILDVGATATDQRSVTIERQRVFVRTPAGRRVPLASQAEFSQAYSDLRIGLRRANVLQNATYSFPATRRPCRFDFYSVPGAGVTFDSVWINDKRVCYERLLFDVPGGVVPGRWMLGIDLEESDLRIPFQL